MKTSELTRAALNWAVATADGKTRFDFSSGGVSYWLAGWDRKRTYPIAFAPSTDWAQGGPIIEREGISLYLDTNNLWQANIFDGNPAVFGTGVEGSTPLIAAMRCYVASKLGDEVEIPDELK